MPLTSCLIDWGGGFDGIALKFGWRFRGRNSRIEIIILSIRIDRGLVVAMDVQGLGAFCPSPTRSFRVPSGAKPVEGKDGGSLIEAGLRNGEEAQTLRACLLQR